MGTESDSEGRIEATRRVMRRAGELCAARGGTIEEVAIGASFAAFDLAERFAGEGVAAIEWLRNSIDVLERSVMKGVRRGDTERPN